MQFKQFSLSLLLCIGTFYYFWSDSGHRIIPWCMYINTLEKKKTNEVVQEISENELKQKYSLVALVKKACKNFIIQFSSEK